MNLWSHHDSDSKGHDENEPKKGNSGRQSWALRTR